MLFKHHSKQNHPRVLRDAFVDWALILSVALGIAVCLIVVGVYVYIDMQDRFANANTTVLKPHEKFDVVKLNKILSQFDERAKERVLLRTGYSDVRDPSLP